MDKALEARLQNIEDQLSEHVDFHKRTLEVIGKIAPCFEKLKAVVDECCDRLDEHEKRILECEPQ